MGGSRTGTDFLLAVDGHALTGFLFSLPHSVKGPELINMYVGQSEENVRNGEEMHLAPACGKIGLFCGAGGKEVVLKLLFPTPTHSFPQGHEPNRLLHPVCSMPQYSFPSRSLSSCHSFPWCS